MAKKRIKLHEQGAHNDIKYSGPLSFQSFQILGWTCIVITVVMSLMKIAMKVSPADPPSAKDGGDPSPAFDAFLLFYSQKMHKE